MKENLQKYFDVIDTEEKAYWLGFICADGYLSKDGYYVGIKLQGSDDTHLKKLADIFEIKLSYRNDKSPASDKILHSVFINLCSKHMSDSLRKKELTNHKSQDLCETIFSYVPKNLWSHFIRGFFDGDGGVTAGTSSKTGQTTFDFQVLGTESFLKKLTEILCRECGIDKINIQKRVGVYRIKISGSYKLFPIRDYLYKDATVFLERKHTVFMGLKCRKKFSQYRGISFNKKRRCWVAQITTKSVCIGYFKTEIEAALAYDKEAKKRCYPKYRLNFK